MDYQAEEWGENMTSLQQDIGDIAKGAQLLAQSPIVRTDLRGTPTAGVIIANCYTIASLCQQMTALVNTEQSDGPR